MHIIAIDVGASFLKCAKISEKTGEIESMKIVGSGNLEKQDGYKILGILALVKQLIRDFSEKDAEVAVAFSTEMHGFVLADDWGEPLTDYISWQETYGMEKRGNISYLDVVKELIPRKNLLETGMPLRAGLPSVNLYSVLQSHNVSHERGKLHFYTMGDFLIRNLTGRQPYVHPTNAAATGLYNLRTKDWDWKIIECLGFGEVVFPGIGENGHVITVNRGQKKYVFFPAIGDQQAALLGSGFWNKNQVSLNFGTGAQVSRLSERMEISTIYQTRPYFKGYYLKTIPHIPSGRAINVYFRFIKDIIAGFADVPEEQVWDFILKEAGEYGRGDLKMELSFFENPITERTVGYIDYIGEYSLTVGNLFASIYETMARDTEKMMDRLTGEPFDEFIFSGGVARKTECFRRAVLERFPDVKKSFLAENETLKGLYYYIREGGTLWEK